MNRRTAYPPRFTLRDYILWSLSLVWGKYFHLSQVKVIYATNRQNQKVEILDYRIILYLFVVCEIIISFSSESNFVHKCRPCWSWWYSQAKKQKRLKCSLSIVITAVPWNDTHKVQVQLFVCFDTQLQLVIELPSSVVLPCRLTDNHLTLSQWTNGHFIHLNILWIML